MGGAKGAWSEDQEEGFTSIAESYVCSTCFDDYAIQEFIEQAAESLKCDYCGSESEGEEPIAAPLDAVVELIVEGIKTEWGQPGDEGVGWCSGEGGWLGAKVVDTWDLLSEELSIGFCSDDLFKDVRDAFTDDEWCEKDPYGDPLGDQWLFDWQHFSKQVKHHTRYVFFKLPKRAEGKEWYQPSDNPYDILYEIGDIVNRLGLIVTIPAGTDLVRVRVSKDGVGYTTVAELGPPPIEKAVSANRMSPAGIPMFYGAFDEATALAEITKKTDAYATIGKFELLREVKVLDLTKLPSVPSIFDRERRDDRQAIFFMFDFLEDFSKPIDKNGSEHIEYVPTQIVTEYFRHIYQHGEDGHIDGIVYPSSVSADGKACVLFCNINHCTQDGAVKEKKLLSLRSGSLKTIKL